MAIAVRRVSWQLARPPKPRPLRGDTGLLEAHGLFDGDLIEGIHRHLDVGQIDIAGVRT
jgi:hypothetical protein